MDTLLLATGLATGSAGGGADGNGADALACAAAAIASKATLAKACLPLARQQLVHAVRYQTIPPMVTHLVLMASPSGPSWSARYVVRYCCHLTNRHLVIPHVTDS